MSTTPQEKTSRLRMPALFTGLRGVDRADLPREVLAGITLAALMIPLNIGYAGVAGLPPVVGLYAAIVPMIAYAIFSTSRNVVASPDAAIAALIGAVLISMASPDDPRYVDLALGLALVSGVIFFLFWLFRLGYLANFLSRAVLVGFITGLGIEVLTSQIIKIMGVEVHAEGYFAELAALVREIPQANLYSVALGVGAILIIRLTKRYAPKVPGALLALIIMTALVALYDLEARGVSVLGEVPAGLPGLTFPNLGLGDYISLVPAALSICAITLAEGLLLARKYAQQYEYKVDGDEEMLAYSAANIASGLTGGLVVGTSASRSAAMDDAGVRSQIPSLVAAVAVAGVLLFFSDFLALLPNAVLGGIVANAVLSLIEVGEMRELYHLRRSEFWIAVVCLLSVLVIGALPAVVIAFLLSVIDVVGRAAKPKTAVLSELPGGGGYYASAGSEKALTVPGLIIYRFGLPIFFANAHYFQEQVTDLIEESEPPPDWFVLDAEAIGDVDTTGAEALAQVIALIQKKGTVFAISRAYEPLRALLAHYELLEMIGEERLYATNREAVAAFYEETGREMPDHIAALRHLPSPDDIRQEK